MKKRLSCLCCAGIISLTYFAALPAETTEMVLSNSMKCTKEELMRFYPEQVVQSILIKANLPREKAEAIAQELSQKDKELDKLIEEKSAKVEPNFSKDLSQRELANKIYRETLYEIFAKVLRAHGITDQDQIQNLLYELQDARSKLFIECIRKQPLNPSEPSL